MVKISSFRLPGMECVFLLADHDPPQSHAQELLAQWEETRF